MEERDIDIDGRRYNYKLKRKFRAKYLRLAVHNDGSLVVTAPKIYPVFLVKQFLLSKAKWIAGVLARHEKSDSIFKIKHSDAEIKKYKQRTRQLVEDRLRYFNQFYNLSYNRIAIRNQSTRWGSCSSRANLNFNYRLCLLPKELADYIVVHELCHIKEMNHSKAFWNLVVKTIPRYKELRKRLKVLS